MTIPDPKDSERRMVMAFKGEAVTDPPTAPGVECPQCHHRFVPGVPAAPTRVTESAPTATATRRAEYADDARAWPLGTEAQARAAWEHWGGTTGVEQTRTRAALARYDVFSSAPAAEALINGRRSWDDFRELVRKAVRAAAASEDIYGGYCWVSILDLNDTDVVWMSDGDQLWQSSYSVTGDTVTLGGSTRVERSYSPSSVVDDPAAVGETVRARIDGGARVLEAKGTDPVTGQRIFRVQVIVPGDSKNRRRYPEAVLRKASTLYEGAKAYDHHRTEAEMSTGTVQGLVGYHRNVEVNAAGAIESDLYVLPSATLVVEALDAALALAAESTDAPPLVGISHDVLATFRPIREGGVQLQEATGIEQVFSADVVSDPAAGGRPTRVVAGGIDPDNGGTSATTSTKETDVPPTLAEVLAVLKEATPQQLAELNLAAKASEAAPAPVKEKTTETVETVAKATWMGRQMISAKFAETSLPDAMLTGFHDSLPDQVSEAQVDASLKGLLDMLAPLERAGLTSKVTVTKEAHEKKTERLDHFFDGNYRDGYRSFKQAWEDFTARPRESWHNSFDEDVNRQILQECAGTSYNSASRTRREAESLNSTSWDVVLGDSIHRRMIKMWNQPSLQAWRRIVSETNPVNDFRTQRRDRIGGYGLLPIVGEQAPYQPLTSPTDEEAIYNIIKRGGTEGLTLEMIANDDIGAIRNIPMLLGRAAAITLYRFILDMLVANATCTFDSTALFHTDHANTDNPALLGQSTLSAARKKMRKQASYGEATNILSIIPKTILVPAALEEMAMQLTQSAVAIPATPAGPSNTPNLHKGMEYEVIDYWTDDNDWFLVADPALSPLIEVGFYQGREEPELFTQADPNVGSMFNADVLTYKIRHIYGATILDYRGFYRGAN